MATVYKFQVSLPLYDTLPRNRCTNVFHLEHVTGGLGDPDLETMCSDIAELYQTRYGRTDKEVMVKAYDTDAKPNYPRATVVVNGGFPWAINAPPEVALCLSYAADNRGNKSERGRIYLQPQIGLAPGSLLLRPSDAQLDAALLWYTAPNASFPDLGGVDWKFGVYSPTYKKFTQSTQAWVNDDWDIQRRRGMRESKRVAITREG